MRAKALDFVPAPPLSVLFPTPGNVRVGEHLDGSSSLAGMSSTAARKPLVGYTATGDERAECLLAHDAMEQCQAPAVTKQSSLKSFFKVPVPATPASAAAPEVAVESSDADQRVDSAEADDNTGDGAETCETNGGEDETPSWAASGGMILAVCEEMVQHTLQRDRGLLSAEERHWLSLMLPHGQPEAATAAADASSSAPMSDSSSLSIEARALYARLFARRGVAFVLSSLDYIEAGGSAAVATVAAELQAAGMVRLVSADTALDGPVDASAASAVLELLSSKSLKQLCQAAGLPARLPLVPTSGVASSRSSSSSSGGAAAAEADGPVAEMRRQLRVRLGLPQPRRRLQRPDTRAMATEAFDAAAAVAVAMGGVGDAVGDAAASERLGAGITGTSVACSTSATTGVRLRPAQRSALVRRIFSLLGGRVILLAEPPVHAMLRSERLFFAGSFCPDLSSAAAAAMGCRNMRPPSFVLPSAEAERPALLPHRSVLLRYEASIALARAYEGSVQQGDEGEMGRLAHLAYRLLQAVTRRRLVASGHDCEDEEAEGLLATSPLPTSTPSGAVGAAEGWSCSRCTFRHEGDLSQLRACTICNADRATTNEPRDELRDAPHDRSQPAWHPAPSLPSGACRSSPPNDDIAAEAMRLEGDDDDEVAVEEKEEAKAVVAADLTAPLVPTSHTESAALLTLCSSIVPPRAPAGWLQSAEAGWLTRRLHPCEAEGWEARRQTHAVGARLCFGWVCASVLSVHVAWLEKRRMYEPASYLLQMLLRLPFLPRRRGQWWIRLCIDRDHQSGARKADAALLLTALSDVHLAPADVVDLARRARKLGGAVVPEYGNM